MGITRCSSACWPISITTLFTCIFFLFRPRALKTQHFLSFLKFRFAVNEERKGLDEIELLYIYIAIIASVTGKIRCKYEMNIRAIDLDEREEMCILDGNFMFYYMYTHILMEN